MKTYVRQLIKQDLNRKSKFKKSPTENCSSFNQSQDGKGEQFLVRYFFNLDFRFTICIIANYCPSMKFWM